MSPEFPTFQIDETVILPEYLRQLCMCPWFWHEMKRWCKGSVLRRMRLNATDLLTIPMRFPNLDCQQAIVNEIAAMQRALGLAVERREQTAVMQKITLRRLFGD